MTEPRHQSVPSIPDPSDPEIIGVLNRLGAGFLPGLMGVQITHVERGRVEAQLTQGTLAAAAALVHGGRTTQVWDSEVTDAADGRLLALFRCTQAVLWPR